MQNLLRFILRFGAAYLFLDGAIHLINIRLTSVLNIWPQSAISYATLLNMIYASFVFLSAGLLLVIQKDIKKYKAIIIVSGIWAFLHSILLTSLSFSGNYINNFLNLPSLYVWISFYDQYLLFEASLAFAYSIIIFLYFKGGKNG